MPDVTMHTFEMSVRGAHPFAPHHITPSPTMVPVPTDVSYDGAAASSSSGAQKRCVVVGLGMVGIAFCEKLLKMDLDGGRNEWQITV